MITFTPTPLTSHHHQRHQRHYLAPKVPSTHLHYPPCLRSQKPPLPAPSSPFAPRPPSLSLQLLLRYPGNTVMPQGSLMRSPFDCRSETWTLNVKDTSFVCLFSNFRQKHLDSPVPFSVQKVYPGSPSTRQPRNIWFQGCFRLGPLQTCLTQDALCFFIVAQNATPHFSLLCVFLQSPHLG
jgi:hypothetical protein